MTDGEHIHERPGWTCRRCGEHWPCRLAREQLAANLQPTTLRITMWLCLELAASDLPDMSADGAYRRFIAWTGAAWSR